jgi:Uma2 family endonuclease
MGTITDLIDEPLSAEGLAARFRELCDDPRFANLPGKIELDVWGRIVMSPGSNLHGMLQARLVQRLAVLGGQAFAEASVTTPAGVLVADVAWGSPAFVAAHRTETPFRRAPELCIEIASPSNSRKALNEKVSAYLAAGAVEVWLVHPGSRRIECLGPDGALAATRFAVDLDGLFD